LVIEPCIYTLGRLKVAQMKPFIWIQGRDKFQDGEVRNAEKNEFSGD